jgi:hypothetical protein
VVEAGARRSRARGGPFIGGRGGGRGRWRAPVRRARDDNDGAQWWRRDGSGQAVVMGWLGTGAGTQGANLAGGRVMARRRGGAVAGGDRVDSRSRAGTKVLTGEPRLPEGERGASERGFAADGWGRLGSGRGGVVRARAVGP